MNIQDIIRLVFICFTALTVQGKPLPGGQLFDPLSSLGSDKPLGLLFGVADQLKNVNSNIQPLASLSSGAGGAQDPQHIVQSILSPHQAAQPQAASQAVNAGAAQV